MNKALSKPISLITAIVLTLSLIVSLDIIAPIQAATRPTTATDADSGFSLEFGYGSSCDGSEQTVAFSYNNRTNKRLTTRIKYAAAGYQESYNAGDLKIQVSSPFPIYSIGADRADATTKTQKFSYKILQEGSYYVYELNNNEALDGSAFDGYIDVIWDISWNRLTEFCGISSYPSYEEVVQQIPSTRPFSFSCYMGSEQDTIKGLSLSMGMYVNVDLSVTQRKITSGSGSSLTGAPTPEYTVANYTFNTQYINGLVKPDSEEIIIEIPEYAEITDNTWTEVESNHPILQLHSGYKAYYTSGLNCRILYPPAYSNTNQTIYGHIYTYYTNDRNGAHSNWDKQATASVNPPENTGEDDQIEPKPDGNGSKLSHKTATPHRQYNTSNVPPEETGLSASVTYEDVLSNGIYLNQKVVSGQTADAATMATFIQGRSKANTTGASMFSNIPDTPVVDPFIVPVTPLDGYDDAYCQSLSDESISYIPLDTPFQTSYGYYPNVNGTTEDLNKFRSHSYYDEYYTVADDSLSIATVNKNLNSVLLYPNLSETDAISYFEALSSTQNDSKMGITFAMFTPNKYYGSDDATNRFKILENLVAYPTCYKEYTSACEPQLVYYPVEDLYITENSDGTFNIVASSAAVYETASDAYLQNTPYFEEEINSAFYVSDDEDERVDFNTNEFYLYPYELILGSSDSIAALSNSSLQALVEENSRERWYLNNAIAIPGNVVYQNGIDAEVYLGFVEANKTVHGQVELLDESEYSYSYVTVPSIDHQKAFLYGEHSPSMNSVYSEIAPTDTADQTWIMYIRKQGETDYTQHASFEDGYEAGQKIFLPENTVSVKFKYHTTADELYQFALQSPERYYPHDYDMGGWHKLFIFEYGLFVPADTINNFNLEDRTSVSVQPYVSTKTSVDMPQNAMFIESDNMMGLLRTQSDDQKEQEVTEREIDSYGCKMYTTSTMAIFESKGDASANTSVALALPETDDVIVEGHIKGNASIDSESLLDYESTYTEVNPENLTQVTKVSQYVVFPKTAPITPDLENANVSSSYLSVVSSCDSIPNADEYVLSHTSFEYDDISYGDYNVLKIISNFEDDPLVISGLTKSLVSNVGFIIPVKFDKSAHFVKDSIEMYTEIEGSILNGRSYHDTFNFTGKHSDTDPYMVWYSLTDTPDLDQSALSGHREVVLKVASAATYDNYSINAGKAEVGKDYTYKFDIEGVSSQLGKMVIYNKMEDSSLGSEWNGTFKDASIILDGVNYDDFDIYYSTNSNAGTLDVDASWRLLDDSFTEYSTIKSLAIKPAEDLFISTGNEMSVFINMTAPVSASSIGLTAYNESTLYSTTYSGGVPSGVSAPITTAITEAELVLNETSVCIRLRDSDNLEPVAGGEFKIYNAETDQLVSDEVFTSGADGITEALPISRGKYYAAQISAPEGYEIIEPKYPFTISISLLSNELNTVDAYNRRKDITVKIKKTDSTSNAELAGAAFSFEDNKNNSVHFPTGTTNENGEVSINIPWGDYTVSEVTVPIGYDRMTPQVVLFDKDKAGTVVELPLENNRTLGTMKLTAMGEDDFLIPNAEYELRLEGQKIGEYSTDSSGVILLENVLEWGDYTIVPTSDPEGYIRNEEGLSFSISKENLSVNLIDVLKQRLGEIVLVKTDEANDTARLEGARYSLYDVNDVLVREDIITDENGEAVVTNLPWGSYYFQEEAAPFGYSLSDKKTVINVSRGTVSAPQTIAVSDSSTSGSLKITKKVPVSDIDFECEAPVFIFKINGISTTGDNYQFYTLVKLTENSKVVDDFVQGYVVISDLPQGSWTIQEQEVIRYAPSSIICSVDKTADPDNNIVTTNNSITFDLNAITLNGSAEFVNEKLYKEGFASNDLVINSLSTEKNRSGILAQTRAPSYAPATPITIDDIKLSFINDLGETEDIDLTDPKYTVSEVLCEYDEPGTYMYPITVKVANQMSYSGTDSSDIAIPSEDGTTGGINYSPRTAAAAPISGQTVYETVVKIVISEFSYEILEDGTATITEYKGKKSVVEIPSVIDGYTVTQIGAKTPYNGSFTSSGSTRMIGNKYVKKLILPSTIKNISQGAIYNLNNDLTSFTCLEEIVISEGAHIENVYPYSLDLSSSRSSTYVPCHCVLTLEDNVIIDKLWTYATGSNAGSLGYGQYPLSYNIQFGENSFIKEYSDYSLYGIKTNEFVFTEGTEKIMNRVGSYNTTFNKVTIPYSLKYLGQYCFYANNCVVKSVNAYFNSSAFEYIYSVTMPIAIPNALACNYMQSRTVNYDASIMDDVQGWEFYSPQKFLYHTKVTNELLKNSQGSTSIIYPAADSALDIPSNITYIDSTNSDIYNDSYTLNIPYDSNLVEITGLAPLNFTDNKLPDSTELMAIDKINAPTVISEESSLKYLENYYGNTSSGLFKSSTIVIPNNFKTGLMAFRPESSSTIYFNAEDMKLVDGITWDDSKNASLVDYNDSYDINIVIGNKVSSIPSNTFKYDYTSNNTRAGGTAYSYDATLRSQKLLIPSNVHTIEESAFENVSIKNIYLEEGLRYLDKKAFYSEYGSRTTVVGDYVYSYDLGYNLSGVNESDKIVLPDSLEFIGERVFGPSDTITSIEFGSNIKYIHPEFIDVYGYPRLEQVTISPNNPYFVCDDGKTIYDKNKTRIIFSVDKNVELGPVGDSEDEMVIISNTLMHVNNPSSSITVPEGVTSIAPGAFYGIKADSINLPQSLVSIQARAFYNSSIKNITIPKNVESIGDKSFTHENHASIISQHTGYASNSLLTVFDGYVETTLEFSENSNLQYVGKKAFAGLNLVGDLIIPASVETINDLAFAACSKIDTVCFESGSALKHVNFGAFISCGLQKNLKQSYAHGYSPVILSLPDSLEYIDDLAFYYALVNSYDFRELDKVKYIGDFAFSEAAIRTTVRDANNYTDENTLYSDLIYMEDMRHIIIPPDVESIGLKCFSAGPALSGIKDSFYCISSVYLMSDDIEIKTHSTFGAMSYPTKYWGLFGDKAINNKHTYDEGFVKIYGCSDKIEELCNNLGYRYIEYSPKDNSGFEYISLDDGTLEITGATPEVKIANRSMTVPSVINGKRVSSVAPYAFTGVGDRLPVHSCVREVIFEEGITSIGKDLFFPYELKNEFTADNTIPTTYYPTITSIKLPETAINIDSLARGCYYLHSLDLPIGASSIGTYFNSGTNITELHLPSGMTEIPDGWGQAVYSCNIYIPSSVTRIGDNALTMGSSYAIFDDSQTYKIEELGNSALSQFTISEENMKSIASSLKSIGRTPFGSRFDLTQFESTLSFDNLKVIPSGASLVLKNAAFPALEEIQENACLQISGSFDWGESCNITSIPKNAFSRVTCENFSIPDSVTYIGANLFTCSITNAEAGVVTLKLPKNGCVMEGTSIATPTLTNIINIDKVKAFKKCGLGLSGMTGDMVINADEIELGSYLFQNCGLSSVTFASENLSITKSSDYSNLFYNCNSLTDIYFKDATPDWDVPSLFRFIPAGTTIHVPSGSLDTYLEWSKDKYYSNTTTYLFDKIQDGTINLIEE